ncbi:MAG TPA: HAMP domain-containing sensor histidine kinase [Gaiellaceae bacterium]|nr:HAMP domain-containing sensor histidine kinase [Gaiellaceae bacterium]
MLALRSLRVRLPLVFLAGIVLAGAIGAVIAIRLIHDFARDQAYRRLTREAHGIAQLYASAIDNGYANGKLNQRDQRAPTVYARKTLEQATGDRIYYVGPRQLFPGQQAAGLRRLTVPIDWHSGKSLSFELTPPGQHRRYYAVVNPIVTGSSTTIAGIVVATPKTDVSATVNSLLGRMAVAGLLGLLVAGAFAWYLSRQIVRPVLQLSDAADGVAAGDYAVDVPHRAPGELGHLSERFGEMAARLAEVEELERNFLMSVSHELRTPLTAIRGHVAALLEGVVTDPELASQSLATVEAEARRLERLVGDILDLAKLDAHRFTVTSEEVDMAQLLDQAFERYREEAQRRAIDYRREGSAAPVITSDGDRVLQVVGNLLSNAFQATPDGGSIRLRLAQQNGTVRVTVEDTGPGIPAEVRERLFRPFESNRGGGTGLGLAIAKELSTALGGSLEVESQVGRGSRFSLVLPNR